MTKTATSVKAAKLTISTPTTYADVKPPVGTVVPPHQPPADKTPSKQAQLIALLLHDAGATLDQMITVTGWLPHTTRAALTGLKKKGYAISSDKVDDVRTYRAVAPEAAS